MEGRGERAEDGESSLIRLQNNNCRRQLRTRCLVKQRALRDFRRRVPLERHKDGWDCGRAFLLTSEIQERLGKEYPVCGSLQPEI